MYNSIQYASGPPKIYNLPIHLYYNTIKQHSSGDELKKYIHRTQNSELRTQNSKLRTQNSEIVPCE